jgi:hypothetical protein
LLDPSLLRLRFADDFAGSVILEDLESNDRTARELLTGAKRASNG